jgi:hypothetical protein
VYVKEQLGNRQVLDRLGTSVDKRLPEQNPFDSERASGG